MRKEGQPCAGSRKFKDSVVVTVGFQIRQAYSAAESWARSTDLSASAPEAFFSNCWIFNSASASLAWQILASCVPSSKRANSVSSGRSSDSIDSTTDSSFFNASSKGSSFPSAAGIAAGLFGFDTSAKLRQLGQPV